MFRGALWVVAVAGVALAVNVPSAFALHADVSSMGVSCVVCHDLHAATGGGDSALFIVVDSASDPVLGSARTLSADVVNASTEDLCEYCHVYQGHNAPQVYGQGLHDGDNANTMAQHAIGFAGAIPDGTRSTQVLDGDGRGGLGCVDCHNALPHGGDGYTAVKMRTPSAESQNLYAKDADVTAFCTRCHTDNNVVVLGGSSHLLTGSRPAPFTMRTTVNGVRTVAWRGTVTCLSCHSAAEFHNLVSYSGAPGSRAATGLAFTNFGGGTNGSGAYSTSKVADGLCATCHTDAGTFAVSGCGVGTTY